MTYTIDNMITNQELGQWVLEARKFADLTQSELGDAIFAKYGNVKIGITKGNLSQIEKGNTRLTIEAMLAIKEITKFPLPKAFNEIGVVYDLEENKLTRVNQDKSTRVWVFGKGMGGLPDRIWDDGGYLSNESDEYANVFSVDEAAFIIKVEGDSMYPRYMPGDYALIEPNTDYEIEDDVLIRLKSGETMIKRMLGMRGNYRFGSYNNDEIITVPHEGVIWIYYVAHPVPAKKIRSRVD